MENKNDDLKKEEFSFITEKIVPKKKRKLKKFAGVFLTTVFLAVLFGFLARFVFIKSGSFFYDVLGMEQEDLLTKEQRKQIALPTTPGNEPSPLPTVTVPPSPSAQPTQLTPSPKPEPTKEPEEEKDTPPKQKADLEDYISMMANLRALATEVNQSMLKVRAIKENVNWLSENYDITQEVPGLIIADNGVELLLLCSYDKVQDANSLEVILSTNVLVNATLFSYDAECNLAVLAVKLKQIPEAYYQELIPAKLGESNVIYAGMPIFALGNPNGYTSSLEIGFITSKNNAVYIMDNRLDLFHMDITNTQNSSGIVVNLRGEVIGIITTSLKNHLNTDVSTAIGITKLKPIILQLLNGNERVYFGIHGEDIPMEVLEEMGLDNGIYVTDVAVDSPAALAGVKVGDVITRLEDSAVYSMNAFSGILSSYQPEEKAQLIFCRKIKEEMKEIKVEVQFQKKK